MNVHLPAMLRRSSCISGVALAIAVLALSATSAAAQFITTWVPLDPARSPAMIGEGFAVTHSGERTAELVLIAYRLQDGRVVATHRSAPFKVAPDRPFPLDGRYLPGPRFHEGKVTGGTVLATNAVPLTSADRDASIWWRNVQRRVRWETDGDARKLGRRDTALLIVVPADVRLWNEALTQPMLVRLETASR